MYCGRKNHTHQNCFYPHTRCHVHQTCVVPEVHKYGGATKGPCPYRRLHVQDDTFEDGGAYDDVDWEAEDRGD